MMQRMPIIIHHETGEKPQTGGKRNQQYLRDCIQQAEKFNDTVILLGDQYNKNWCKNWYEEKKYIGEKWERFERSFTNFSTYPDAWAKGIFRRFFCMENFMKEKGLEKAILLDSDVLVYIDFNKYKGFQDCDAALCWLKNQDLKILEPNNGLVWAASAHTSCFTREALTDFIDFCIDMYENHVDILMQKWEHHKKYGLAGGVCEMTLLYLWMRSRENMIIRNVGMINDASCINYNMIAGDNYEKNEYETNRHLNMKKIFFKNGMPYFKKQDGSMIQALTLHFSGKYKIFIPSIFKREKISFMALMECELWTLRGKLSKIKHSILKN